MQFKCWMHTPIEYLEQHGTRVCVYTARLFGNVHLLLVALPLVRCLRPSPLSSAVPARSSNMVHLCWASKLSISCQRPCYACYMQKVQWRCGNKTAQTNTKHVETRITFNWGKDSNLLLSWRKLTEHVHASFSEFQILSNAQWFTLQANKKIQQCFTHIIHECAYGMC